MGAGARSDRGCGPCGGAAGAGALLALLASLALALLLLDPLQPVLARGAVIVSGASTGIGRDAAENLARRHAGLVVFAGVRRVEDAEAVRAATGFEFESAASVPCTPAPAPGELEALRGAVRAAVSEIYPAFAARAFAALKA